MESRPYVENVTITPQVAQMMLEHNTHNRNLTESRAQAYARDMASGNWRYTGEGIKFGPDGTLLDGQTRLRAIVLSGVTITMPVWRGIDPDAQLVMDSGRPRSNSDALSLRGEKDVVTLRAIICADFQWCHYGAQSAFTSNGKRRVTPSEMLDWLAIRPTCARRSAMPAPCTRRTPAFQGRCTESSGTSSALSRLKIVTSSSPTLQPELGARLRIRW